MRKKNKKDKPNKVRFVTEFIHYRTKKVMRAADYGHKAWPIRAK